MKQYVKTFVDQNQPTVFMFSVMIIQSVTIFIVFGSVQLLS